MEEQKPVTKRLFLLSSPFFDMNRLHFDNIKIAPIFLKTCPEIEIEKIDYNSIFTDFKPNRHESKSKRSRIDSTRFSVPISQSRPCLLLALSANIRLSWKDLPGTNTLTCYKNLSITTIMGQIFNCRNGCINSQELIFT